MLLPQDKLILFFDTETTGFVKKTAPLEENPHIVQLGYIIGMYNGESVEIIDKKSIFINPGVPIPPATTEIHGISDEKVRGCPMFVDICGDFFRAVVDADIIVGHNVNFDYDMMWVESRRIWKDDRKREAWLANFRKKLLCTMEPSTNLCKLQNVKRGGYKWPKLTELYRFLFEKDMENAHDAMVDITATMECFIELHRRKVIVVL